MPRCTHAARYAHQATRGLRRCGNRYRAPPHPIGAIVTHAGCTQQISSKAISSATSMSVRLAYSTCTCTPPKRMHFSGKASRCANGRAAACTPEDNAAMCLDPQVRTLCQRTCAAQHKTTRTAVRHVTWPCMLLHVIVTRPNQRNAFQYSIRWNDRPWSHFLATVSM